MAPKAAPKVDPKKASKAEPVKGKKKADGDKPKRAPSPYIVFCTKKRPEIKAENPDASFGQLGKILGERWAKLTDAQKKVDLLCLIRYQLCSS